MTPDEAITVLARHLLASRVAFDDGSWENYPEIGEYDWRAIEQRANELAVYPADDEFDAAYALLKGRALSEETKEETK